MTHILILEARFYNDLSDMLLEGAKKALDEANATYEVITVMGALELPVALYAYADNEKYNGFVVLGAVIRGETDHYDHVCRASIDNITRIATDILLPVGNGILTTENYEQAIARADINKKNKGGFAAKACLKMIEIIEGSSNE